MYVRIDLTGQKFGRLTVVSHAGRDKHGNAKWNCVCDCGAERTVIGSSLRSGGSLSCGCWQRDLARSRAGQATKHGMHSTPTYYSWTNMLTRCNNPNFRQYQNYGGRGIKVCERWLEFANFLEDMGERPEGTTLDRIDNDGNYEPGNCRWATQEEQLYNRTSTVTWQGKTLLEWHKETGMNYYTMYSRLKRYGELFPKHLDGVDRIKHHHYK